MRRATFFVLLVLSVVTLSGCFTSVANSRLWGYEERAKETWGQNPSAWAPTTGVRRLLCPLRCGGSSPVWAFPGPGDSLFLSLPTTGGGWEPALLSDRGAPCTEPAAAGAPALELVVSPDPLPLAPASVHGLPTRALLVLRLERDRSRTDASLAPGNGSTLLFERDGIRRMVAFEEDFAAMRERNAERARSKGQLWWLVSVPLDVVTSPLQLAAAIVVAPFYLILLMGLGGHRW
jgi:hypothetical protein